MALVKTPVQVNFAQGLDTKTDPNQVQIGNYLSLVNSVFTTTGRLTKRNGFANINNLPNSNQTNLTTLNDNLIATGSDLYAYSVETNQWIDAGVVQPVTLNTQALVRNSTSQESVDIAVTSNGLTCLVYTDNNVAYYQISDSTTGQQIVPRTAIGSSAVDSRAYILGRYFIISFVQTVSSNNHLRYIAIPISNPSAPLPAADIATGLSSPTTGYDAVVVNNTLYIGWGNSNTTVEIAFVTSTLSVSAPVVLSGYKADLVSLTADTSGTTFDIWMSFYNASTNDTYSACFNQILSPILAPTLIVTGVVLANLTSVATNGILTVFYEVVNFYDSTGAYPTPFIRTDYLESLTIDTSGTIVQNGVLIRSVGLASKAFFGPNGKIYLLVAYGVVIAPTLSSQPSYFLIDSDANIIMRLAYSNGGGAPTVSSLVLPNVTEVNDQYYIPYLESDFLTTVNKTTNTSDPQVTPIYSQTGVMLAKIAINESGQYSSEIASALHLTGGQLWEYDGVKPVELGFHVWPENIAYTTATTGGNLFEQVYFYQFLYEWTDNQGNIHRSAPSIPLKVDISSSITETNVNTLYVPTLRLTAKISPNPVRIIGYRWSTAQQIYYQFTSVTSPYINDPTVDYITITDTLSDSQILGQAIVYTTGGVIENIAPPASIASALYKNRLFLVDAEDQNLLWFSKQVIENTPVEMSDLLTFYVAPTSGAQGSTGPVTALSAMDDKLIIFKKDAAYYITGNGPDNTGANNDFSEPIYITSSVGCANPNSIVLMPNGLMFQSDKGIWLLGRDLTTSYIGAGVEQYNGDTVMSATAIPGTNQVRFIMASGITLMYDYYQGAWGTFTNTLAISATLYQSLHTYLNKFGQIFQETPGTYIDGSSPVLMSFTTSWISLQGLRGFERFYFMFLLGTYYTPFKLNLQLAYDYNPNNSQSILITPDNYTPNWGGDAQWGTNETWGGTANTFQARIFPQQQKCQVFQISITEIYDPSLGIAAGQGLSLSGMNIVVGAKKGYSTQKASRSFG